MSMLTRGENLHQRSESRQQDGRWTGQVEVVAIGTSAALFALLEEMKQNIIKNIL